MMKNGIYFILIAFLVVTVGIEDFNLCKLRTCDVTNCTA